MYFHAEKTIDADGIEYLKLQRPVDRGMVKSAYIAAMRKIDRMLEDDEVVATQRVGATDEGLAFALNPEQTSSTGDRFQKGKILNIDSNTDFLPTKARGTRGRPADYQRLAKDPTFSEGADKVWESLVSGFLFVQPLDKHDTLAIEQAAIINENLNSVVTSQVKYEWVGGAFDTGFAAWEIVDQLNGAVASVSNVRADVVDSWLLDESEHNLAGIYCETATDKFTIPAQHLWLYSHRRRGNNFDGIPQLREVCVMIEMKWMFLRLAGLAGEMHALGIKTIEKDAEIQQGEASDRVIEIFSNMSAEEGPVVELGAGRRFKWHSPANGMPDFGTIFEFIENQITKKTSTSGTHLTYNEHGSRALAETLTDETAKTGYHYGLLFAESVHSALVQRIQRNRFGVMARPLVTTFRLTNDWKDPERWKRLMSFVTSGMLSWSPTDEAMLREAEGLPPRSAEVQPTVSSLPDNPTDLLRKTLAAPANAAQRGAE